MGGVETSGRIGARHSRGGDIVNGKSLDVTQFSQNPPLDERNVLRGWYFDRDFLVIEPGVCMASVII